MTSMTDQFAIAVQHHQAGRLHEAEQIYRQVLAVDQNNADALHLLGLIFAQHGKHSAAIEHIRRALALRPAEAVLHFNLGVSLFECRNLNEAAACYRSAIKLKPDYAEAWNNLANILQAQEEFEEAIGAYRRAIELKPRYLIAQRNLGFLLAVRGKLNLAAACFRYILSQQPDYAGAHIGLGNCLKDQGSLDDAIACFRRALELDPRCFSAHSSLLYTLWFRSGVDSATIYEEHRRWNEHWAQPLAKDIAAHTNDTTPNRRLRIGYVSPDFRAHVLAHSLVPLFSAHDHQQFEIVCYADVTNPDEISQRLRCHVDQWRDVVGLNDHQLAQLIREDRIDILVDLTMHMERGRLLAFARKPAPVQVCGFAYPGTTGLTTFDYRLTDPHLDPPGLNDRYYSEQSLRLPDSFWCYDPLMEGPAVNSLPALAKGHITFGCLNNFCKVNAGLLGLWARVLNAVEHSRLLLLAPEGPARELVLQTLEKSGISPDRVTFVARQPRATYLELYHQIDIGLDTLPYNGHTTSLDSIWMGVPVVTLVGTTVVGRAGLCQLQNLGLPELIAQTPDQFVEIATGLARDLPRLSQLRASLRERLQASPLMDARRFAGNVESAYRTMWKRWCAAG